MLSFARRHILEKLGFEGALPAPEVTPQLDDLTLGASEESAAARYNGDAQGQYANGAASGEPPLEAQASTTSVLQGDGVDFFENPPGARPARDVSSD